MGPNSGCMGHSRRRSSCPLHRLAIVFRLCSLHQWQIQEGPVMTLRLQVGAVFFTPRHKHGTRTVAAGQQIHARPLEAVIFILQLKSTINILLNTLEFGMSAFLNQ